VAVVKHFTLFLANLREVLKITYFIKKNIFSSASIVLSKCMLSFETVKIFLF